LRMGGFYGAGGTMSSDSPGENAFHLKALRDASRPELNFTKIDIERHTGFTRETYPNYLN